MSRGKKILFLAVLLGFAVLGLDSLHRVTVVARKGPWKPSDLRAELDRMSATLEGAVEATTPGEPPGGAGPASEDPKRKSKPGRADGQKVELRPHPYLGFQAQIHGPRVRREFRKIEAAGQRDDTYIVLLLGGSVAAGCGQFREHLEKVVAADPRFAGKQVKVIRWTHAAYKQPQQLMIVAFLFALGHFPDAVVNLDGFNEVAVSNANSRRGVHPLYPDLTGWTTVASRDSVSGASLERLVELSAQRSRMKRMTESGLVRLATTSSIAGHALLGYLKGLRAEWAAGYERHLVLLTEEADSPHVKGPPFGKQPMLEGVRAFYECSLSLHAMCEARDILYLHTLQPTLHDEGAKKKTAEEIASGKANDYWMEAAIDGYPKLRDAGKRLTARGVEFYDASRIFADIEETLYFDACHFHAPGRILLMEAIGREILSRLPPAR